MSVLRVCSNVAEDPILLEDSDPDILQQHFDLISKGQNVQNGHFDHWKSLLNSFVASVVSNATEYVKLVQLVVAELTF
jgi:hypothetical protein